ncbi:hypothetical protein EVAR_50594_1 [Eumeta japonica]|uniref:Uncharacterized protein n=1 Tax=Eumeta variegata TaxID=151549 RepID=A0A4C1Y9B9_EUMVA|nr:hypothetical protein EVAR_50594_1 [Eumeta japonica]
MDHEPFNAMGPAAKRYICKMTVVTKKTKKYCDKVTGPPGAVNRLPSGIRTCYSFRTVLAQCVSVGVFGPLSTGPSRRCVDAYSSDGAAALRSRRCLVLYVSSELTYNDVYASTQRHIHEQ